MLKRLFENGPFVQRQHETRIGTANDTPRACQGIQRARLLILLADLAAVHGQRRDHLLANACQNVAERQGRIHRPRRLYQHRKLPVLLQSLLVEPGVFDGDGGVRSQVKQQVGVVAGEDALHGAIVDAKHTHRLAFVCHRHVDQRLDEIFGLHPL